MRAIHWFRSDLRLGDNTALAHAARQAEALLPVFVVDERCLAGSLKGAARARFRAIFLTTTTTTAGLLPILTDRGQYFWRDAPWCSPSGEPSTHWLIKRQHNAIDRWIHPGFP